MYKSYCICKICIRHCCFFGLYATKENANHIGGLRLIPKQKVSFLGVRGSPASPDSRKTMQKHYRTTIGLPARHICMSKLAGPSSGDVFSTNATTTQIVKNALVEKHNATRCIV